MKSGQFRCAYSTRRYEATLAFYGDSLGLPVIESWDHGPDDRGTLFGASSGIIEVLAFPEKPERDSVWDHRAPQGISIVVEVDDVDGLYKRVVDRQLTVKEALRNQPWGHRSFIVADPNGVAIYFFAEVQ